MATEWVDVADNAVKIGLGSALTILGGYLTLKLSQRYELRKEELIRRRNDFEVKTERYVNFLSSSRMMLQKYTISNFKPDGDDYMELTRQHETLSLTCSNSIIRELAFDAYYAVSHACTMGTANRDEKAPARKKAKEALDKFQGFASEELRREKAAIDVMSDKQTFWSFRRRTAR
ncbi:TPA: hypothetical protein O2767_004877 [Escherichia coli]|nr:hypothetical protein [Escherichia coli]EFP2267697.1 hypothetical protein [Escherichia coli]EHY9890102.1 hypothetical protein [Escherichia coli]HCZ4563291.1 hypothetical protein [Escherichia coli]